MSRTKKEIFVALKQVLDCYESYRTVLHLSPEKSVDKTLRTYDDFYEWLGGCSLTKSGTPRKVTK